MVYFLVYPTQSLTIKKTKKNKDTSNLKRKKKTQKTNPAMISFMRSVNVSISLFALLCCDITAFIVPTKVDALPSSTNMNTTRFLVTV